MGRSRGRRPVNEGPPSRTGIEPLELTADDGAKLRAVADALKE